MRRIAIAAALSVLLFAVWGIARAQQPEAAADLKDASGRVVGHATFTQSLTAGGVWIHVDVAGIAPGAHAIHIHGAGICEGPGFLSASGHFNPGGRQHGLINPEGPHAGDLPNMTVDATGKGHYDTANYRVTLGSAPDSLFKPGGTSLVIHAGPDDNVTDPAGNSGARIACGTIIRP